MQKGQLPPEFPVFLLVAIIVVGVLAVLIGLAIMIFYCLTLQKALNQVSERNRLMQPGMVWLLLIPCFGLIWQFFIAMQVPDSLKNEFRDRGKDDGGDYGKTIGLTQCGLYVGGTLISIIPFIGVCGALLSLVGFVMFIIFWVKIAGYSSQLASGGGRRIRTKRDRDDDDDDD